MSQLALREQGNRDIAPTPQTRFDERVPCDPATVSSSAGRSKTAKQRRIEYINETELQKRAARAVGQWAHRQLLDFAGKARLDGLEDTGRLFVALQRCKPALGQFVCLALAEQIAVFRLQLLAVGRGGRAVFLLHVWHSWHKTAAQNLR